MKPNIIISIDAMGGANAPFCIIEAISNVSKQASDAYFLIFGNEMKLAPLLEANKVSKNCYEIIHTADFITDDEQPVKALKRGKESSMRMAIDAVKDGRANACISGGNTGALMVMAKLVLGSLPGIKRPAIISVFPSLKDGVVMTDLGANTECDEHNFYQFAVMAHCFAKVVNKKANPSIGILNVGVEDHKGRELEKKAFSLLSNSGLNFIGHVEPYDVTAGKVDVVVTDGFTGNILIKTAEGTAKICNKTIKDAFKSSLFGMIGGFLARKSLKRHTAKLDPRYYNGAMFIGVNGIVVKSHGSSDAIAVEHALQVTINLVKRDINMQISDLFNYMAASTEEDGSLIAKLRNKLGF